MKQIITTLLILFPYFLSAQTYLGLSINKEFTQLKNYGHFANQWSELKPGSGDIDIPISLGVHFDSYFRNNFAFTLNSRYYTTSFTGYNFETRLFLQKGYDLIKQNHITHQVSIRYYPVKNWSVGLGGNYARLLRHRIYMPRENIPAIDHRPSKGNISIKYGWQLLSAYTYRNFLFMLTYENKRTFVLSTDNGFDYFNKVSYQRFSSFTFTFSYRFQILKKPLRLGKKNKLKCADF